MQWLRVSSKDLRSWEWLSCGVGREEAKITSTSLPGLSQGQRKGIDRGQTCGWNHPSGCCIEDGPEGADQTQGGLQEGIKWAGGG